MSKKGNEVILSKGRKFPATVHLKWEGLDQEEPWLGTFEDPEDALTAGEVTYVAEYRLVKVTRGVLVPEFK